MLTFCRGKKQKNMSSQLKWFRRNRKDDHHLHPWTLPGPCWRPRKWGRKLERNRQWAHRILTSAERMKLRPILNRSSRKVDVQPLESTFPLRRHCNTHEVSKKITSQNCSLHCKLYTGYANPAGCHQHRGADLRQGTVKATKVVRWRRWRNFWVGSDWIRYLSFMYRR